MLRRSKPFKAHHLQHIAYLAADGFLVQLFEPQTKGHVLEHVQVREQRIFLEHRIHRALVGRHTVMSFPFSSTLPACWLQKTCDEAQGGGFAAAGGTQQRYKLLIMDIQIQPIQNALSIKFHYDIPQ